MSVDAHTCSDGCMENDDRPDGEDIDDDLEGILLELVPHVRRGNEVVLERFVDEHPDHEKSIRAYWADACLITDNAFADFDLTPLADRIRALENAREESKRESLGLSWAFAMLCACTVLLAGAIAWVGLR
ncbi:MAG: hypothetical protein AAFV29_17460 [Myxococcota bacterium]